MAYKAILAADTGAASKSVKVKSEVKGKSALASGRYTFYWESSTPIGTPSDPTDKNPKTDAAWKFQECLDACDAEGDCLAAGMTKVTKAAKTGTQTDAEVSEVQAASPIGSCRLVKGVMSAGVGKRSVTKVNLNLLSMQKLPNPGEHSCCLCCSYSIWNYISKKISLVFSIYEFSICIH